MSRAGLTGHAAALLTIFLWGTTFISTKVLLTGLRPVPNPILYTISAEIIIEQSGINTGIP